MYNTMYLCIHCLLAPMFGDKQNNWAVGLYASLSCDEKISVIILF